MSIPEDQFDRLQTPNPEGDPREQPGSTSKATDQDIIRILSSYKDEAQQARKEGPNGRDEIWESNWDLYWGRMDYSGKADWQSQEVMPEAPQFVDRWAASMREALNQPGRWYQAIDPTGQDKDLSKHIEKFLDVLLANAGRTPDGHPSDFESQFEDLMKIGCLMAMSATVTWESGEGPGGGKISVDVNDPRQVWLDHTGRGLYRLRSYEVDKHVLEERARATDAFGEPIYNPEAVADLHRNEREERREERETSTGHAQQQTSPRQPVTIDEWLATIVDNDGTVIARDALVVVGNDRVVLRGPEPNPFWHGRDWTLMVPMVSVPLSIYGRSYMEDWASVARAFIEMTNLIMDGTFTSTMNAYGIIAEALEDPTQAQEGVTPNKTFVLEAGQNARDFLHNIELGRLPPESLRVWEGLKAEMREGAKLSEISLGQVPPKGDITATEVSAVQQSTSSLIRSMARTIETRLLEPMLEMIWQTGLQHVDFADPMIQQELGEETARMLQVRKQEFRQRAIRFQVRGLSALVERQSKLQNLLSALNTIASSEVLLREFLQTYSVDRLVQELLRLYGIDTLDLQQSPREQKIRQIIERMNQQQGQEPGSGEARGPQRAPEPNPQDRSPAAQS